jgi:hypothetical protein
MSPRPVLWLGSVLLLAACDDQIVSPPAPEAAPTERPQLTFGTPQYDAAHAATVDRLGFVYVAGRTDGSLDGPHQGAGDFFVRKYHPTGDMLWADQFGTHLNDWANGIAADADGNVYVVGQTEGSLAGSRGGLDAFIRKYDTNGALQWTRQYGAPANASDYATAVAVSPDGSAVYVVGSYSGHTATNHTMGFLIKYDSDGVLFWNRNVATSNNSVKATGVAVGPLGHVYVVGYAAGLVGVCCAAGGEDALLVKYDNNGNLEWNRQFGTSGHDHAYGVAVDLSGDPIIVGATLGPDQSRWGGGKAYWSASVWKYQHDGVPLHHALFGTNVSDRAFAVSVNPFNEIYVAGVTDGALDGASAGASDVFVRAYPGGSQPPQPLWTRQFGTSADDRAFAVAASGDLSDAHPSHSRQVYVAGATAGTLVGANRGKYDAFLRRLDGSGNVSWTDQ